MARAPMAPSLPLYLTTGAVGEAGSPRSSTTRSSLADSGLAGSESTTPDFESVNTPLTSPVLVMSVEPLWESPGTRPETLRIAPGAAEFEWLRLPAVTMLPALALVDVKLAPDATAIMPARERANSAPTSLRGDACQRAVIRCMSGLSAGCP